MKAWIILLFTFVGINPAHHKIQLESSRATVAENTAVVTGKAKFTAASGRIKSALPFSYMEVFTRLNEQSPWKYWLLMPTVFKSHREDLTAPFFMISLKDRDISVITAGLNARNFTRI